MKHLLITALCISCALQATATDGVESQNLQTRVLFYDSFGYFLAEDVYVTEGKVYQYSVEVDHLTTVKFNRTGDVLTSGDYDAEGMYFSARASGGDAMSVDITKKNNFTIRNYVTPDPTGHVVTATKFVNVDGNGENQFVGTDGHLYMTENPMLGEYDIDGWLEDASLRLQDGYYAIVCSPDTCDHNKNEKDFITCSDYTGNKKGALLFVNAGQTNNSKAAIYARKVSMNSPADRFKFGMSVRNASYKKADEQIQNPVNVTICFLKEFNENARQLPSFDNSNVLAHFSSGDVAVGLETWTRLDKSINLDEKVQDVWVVLYNTGEPGDGNNMLLDDITFSVCLPKDESCVDVEGILPGKFSVSSTKQMQFSKGNLQYQASTDTWKFADNQYDMADGNFYVSETNTSWMDLFGWATSGYKGMYPYLIYLENDYDDQPFLYGPWSDDSGANNNLTEANVRYDWGVNNAISNGGNQVGLWRVPTMDEWVYLIERKDDGGKVKYAFGQVNDVKGLILLPDEWTLPEGMMLDMGKVEIGSEEIEIENNFTPYQWSLMETNGAVFLPACGTRGGLGISFGGEKGGYWSSTAWGKQKARYLYFSPNSVYKMAYDDRYFGNSVRLVYEETSLPTSIEKTDTEAVEPQVRKVFENGKIIIIKDGVKYNMQGVKVIEN